VPSPDKVLRDPKEISDTHGHPFEIPHTQEANECLVRNLLRLLVADESTREREHPVVGGCVEIPNDAGTHALEGGGTVHRDTVDVHTIHLALGPSRRVVVDSGPCRRVLRWGHGSGSVLSQGLPC
jgi:hypothetical protein